MSDEVKAREFAVNPEDEMYEGTCRELFQQISLLHEGEIHVIEHSRVVELEKQIEWFKDQLQFHGGASNFISYCDQLVKERDELLQDHFDWEPNLKKVEEDRDALLAQATALHAALDESDTNSMHHDSCGCFDGKKCQCTKFKALTAWSKFLSERGGADEV